MHYIILVEFHIKEKYKDNFKSKYYLVCKYYDEGYIEYNILREDTFVQNVKINKAICDNFELKCNNYIDNISNVITMDMNLFYNNYYKVIETREELEHYICYFNAYTEKGVKDNIAYSSRNEAKRENEKGLDHYFKSHHILSLHIRKLLERDYLNINLLYDLLGNKQKIEMYLITHRYYGNRKQIKDLILIRRVKIKMKSNPGDLALLEQHHNKWLGSVTTRG